MARKHTAQEASHHHNDDDCCNHAEQLNEAGIDLENWRNRWGVNYFAGVQGASRFTGASAFIGEFVENIVRLSNDSFRLNQLERLPIYLFFGGLSIIVFLNNRVILSNVSYTKPTTSPSHKSESITSKPSLCTPKMRAILCAIICFCAKAGFPRLLQKFFEISLTPHKQLAVDASCLILALSAVWPDWKFNLSHLEKNTEKESLTGTTKKASGWDWLHTINSSVIDSLVPYMAMVLGVGGFIASCKQLGGDDSGLNTAATIATRTIFTIPTLFYALGTFALKSSKEASRTKMLSDEPGQFRRWLSSFPNLVHYSALICQATTVGLAAGLPQVMSKKVFETVMPPAAEITTTIIVGAISAVLSRPMYELANHYLGTLFGRTSSASASTAATSTYEDPHIP